METRIVSDRVARFGGFRFDLETHELFRKGEEIGIRGHPAQILALLLEDPGKVVSRASLRKSLWPDHTVVDFDHVLNNSINRLREALHDDAASPRFIQTVPGLGYRFVAPLERELREVRMSRHPARSSAEADVRAESRGRRALRVRRMPHLRWWIAAGIVLILALAASVVLVVRARSQTDPFAARASSSSRS